MSRLTDSERKRVEDQIQNVRQSIRNMKDQVQRFLVSGQVSLLQARLDAYDADGNPKLLVMGVRDKPAGPEFGSRRGRFGGPGGFTYDGTRTIADSPVYTRGEPDQPGDSRVARGTLQVMTRAPLTITSTSSGRLEFAEWIASTENPLTARVMVNRIWLQLFGRGLVPTADDFGLAGRPPTHPELLDHLAHRFMDDGWNLKKLIKYLVMSHVYQLSSMADRPQTTVPSQGLFLLNNAFVMRAADAAADRLLEKETEAERIHGAFVRFYSRPPTAREQAGAESFLKAYRSQLSNDRASTGPQERELWSAFCKALFASAEFQYRK